MALIPGVGVNYQSNATSYARDIAYFQEVGLTGVRLLPAMMPNTWAAGSPDGDVNYAQQRLGCQTFLAAGLYVTGGIGEIPDMGPQNPHHDSHGSFTSTVWTEFANVCIAEAAYLQTNGIIWSDFTLGNELEYYLDQTTLTQAILRTNLRSLATTIKANGYTGKLSYSCCPITDITGASNMIAGFVSEGLGDIDYLSIHEYSTIQPYATTGAEANILYVNTTSVGTDVASVMAAFPTKVYCSEFNFDPFAANFARCDATMSINAMNAMLDIFTANALPQFYVWKWYDAAYRSNQWAMLQEDGTMHPAWSCFFDGPMIPYNQTVRRWG